MAKLEHALPAMRKQIEVACEADVPGLARHVLQSVRTMALGLRDTMELRLKLLEVLSKSGAFQTLVVDGVSSGASSANTAQAMWKLTGDPGVLTKLGHFCMFLIGATSAVAPGATAVAFAGSMLHTAYEQHRQANFRKDANSAAQASSGHSGKDPLLAAWTALTTAVTSTDLVLNTIDFIQQRNFEQQLCADFCSASSPALRSRRTRCVPRLSAPQSSCRAMRRRLTWAS